MWAAEQALATCLKLRFAHHPLSHVWAIAARTRGGTNFGRLWATSRARLARILGNSGMFQRSSRRRRRPSASMLMTLSKRVREARCAPE